MVRRTTLALLAATAVVTGCGARSPGGTGVDAPGVLVFSGLPSGPYLHSIRPDGSALTGVALPETCSPEKFTRDGRVLVCFDLSDDADLEHWRYAVQREASRWRRVSMPAEVTIPERLDPSEKVAAPQWTPAGDRIAFIRPTGVGPSWFSSSGEVTVADAAGSNERFVAVDGEAPQWSPDGKRLAFARCRVFEPNWEKDEFLHSTAECSLWTVSSDGADEPKSLVEKAASEPVWSPDGRFVAFLRQSGACETFCRYRIVIVASTGGHPQEVGPELVGPSDDGELWPDLAWLPASAPIVTGTAEADVDEFELQRCVDIWNRAGMHPWPTGAVNVTVVGDLCQITVSDYGGACTQTAAMRFRFWCPSHGAGLHMLPPDYRVWNGHGGKDGKLSLFDPPKGPRLPLPKAPPHPMLDGYVIPFGTDDKPLPGLELIEVDGTCERGTGIGGGDRYPLAYPDGYLLRCWWDGSGSENCFKHPGPVEVGDTVLCPDAPWKEAYDPMRFFKVRVAKLL